MEDMMAKENMANKQEQEPEISDEAEMQPEAAPEIPWDEQIDALSAERDDYRERMMRALADAENSRKRAEKERRDAETYGGTKLARDLLSLYDNLNRAMDSIDDELRANAPGLTEGLELTQKDLLNTFSKHKIEIIAPEIGEPFDPAFHEAMFEAPAPGGTPGTVIQVMSHGFRIADRLLRPAQVGVCAMQAE